MTNRNFLIDFSSFHLLSLSLSLISINFLKLRINPPIDELETTTIIPTPDAPNHIKERVKEVNKKKSTKFNGKKQ